MSISITDEMWEKTWLDGHKLTSSPTQREFEWKTRMRLVSRQQDKATPQNYAGDNAGQIGDHTHVFWDCHTLYQYWRNIQADIKQITGVDLPLEPPFFISEETREGIDTKNRTFLLGVVKMITVLCRNANPPTVQ